MNKITLLIFGLLLCSIGYCQTVTVETKSEKISRESVDGYSADLEGKKDAVNGPWGKFLKEIGKTKTSGSQATITEPVFNSINFSKGIIYGAISEKGDKTRIWLGIKPSEWDANEVNRINHELEKAIHRFGVKFYRDRIQVEIDQAQQALDAVSKQQQRITNQSKDFTISLGNNEQEKISLEKAIESNKFENAVLKTKIENNKKALDSLSQAGVQIEKVRQTHVERQRKVN